MQIIQTEIPDLLIVQPKIFEDERGYFYESYNKKAFIENGITADFVQDNQSRSQKNVLRGLHFQDPPFAQGKLVSVMRGGVLDVAVDIRKNSPYYGKYVAIELSENNKTMFWIPEGFAHGFLTLENDTIFTYKCTNYYNKNSEGCVSWNDKNININWNVMNPILSEKDKTGIPFKDFISKF